jgi:hypothetical protein
MAIRPVIRQIAISCFPGTFLLDATTRSADMLFGDARSEDMRDHYYALAKNESWAAMRQFTQDVLNPPILIFESPEVAQRCRHKIAGDDWEVLEIERGEIEYFAEDSNNRVLLCTNVGDKTIDKYELTIEDLDRRELEAN